MAFAGVTVRDALDGAVTAIGASGSETARLDAELLLAHALGVDRTRLVMEPTREVSGDAVQHFQDLVRRRSVMREPVAYLLGTKGFRYIDLQVDSRVLIPRPETELLVEVGLELPQHARVLDVGAGSGAIALALKQERPDLDVTGSDVSADALAVARANSVRLGLDVTFVTADLLDGAGGPWDAVISNPPYVAERDRDTLPHDVLHHEPAAALFAGEDGLDTVRRLIEQVAATATPLLALEIGAGQAGEVAELMSAWSFTDTEARQDLAGIERVVIGRR